MRVGTVKDPGPGEWQGAAGVALPSGFWAHFVEHYWEKEPFVIRQPFGAPFPTTAETFRGLVQTGDQYRAGHGHDPTAFYLENALLIADVGPRVPAADDGSIAGYAERMRRELDGRRFGLVIDNFHVQDAALWLRLRRFLRGLFEFTGIPGWKVKSTLFLGNYKKTPAGLHHGSAGDLMFVVEGVKRIRVWPREFFLNRKDAAFTHDYEQYLDDSILLEGRAGDILYWPPGYWHIGESAGEEVSVGLSVAFFTKFRPAADLLNHAAGMLEERLESVGLVNSGLCYPHAHQDSLASIREMAELTTRALRGVSQTRKLKQALQATALNRLTGLGFTEVPPPAPLKALHDDDIVCGQPDYPILWLPAPGDELICSASGHAFRLTAHPKIISLLERLNSGAASSVQHLLEEHAGSVQVNGLEFTATTGEVRALLEKLYGLRAINDSQP